MREERIEFVTGLRWMRENTESPGAWNAAGSRSQWGVLSSYSVGDLIGYHARERGEDSEMVCSHHGR